ncbi:MAG: alpha/beta fold hydrolase [Microthrixaceae bacterium]
MAEQPGEGDSGAGSASTSEDSTAQSTTFEQARSYDGARRPDRSYTVDSGGVGLAVVEWGDPGAPALALAHGGFDFVGTYDVFAPMLADGGWRVVAWDQRGHGDSDRAHLYSWEADLRDAATVIATLPAGRLPFVGHSKGGNLVTHLANALPHRISALVNMDGLPSHRAMSDMADHERSRRIREEMDEWLAYRRSLVGKQRKPGTIDELAVRRGRMNPRMSPEWLRYLVTVGAEESAKGWRWKIDPSLRMGGFGPWRPQWSLLQLPGIGAPVLGILGLDKEVMGWGTEPEEVESYLPEGARFVGLEGVGHFVHIEEPRAVADMVLEFLA